MNLAQEMLSSLEFEDSYLEATSQKEEEHIIINQSRQIIVPNSLKTIAVTEDKDIETVTFDCVRYWDGHDLSTFAIYINYVLPNRSKGTYVPKKVEVDESDASVFHFDWLIEQNITKYSGKISFSVVAVKSELSEGRYVTKYRWSSLPNSDFDVASGIAISNVPTEEEASDILSQMSEILAQLQMGGGSSESVANYVLLEANEVSDKILSVRNQDTFVMACASDFHTDGKGQSSIGTKHIGQAMSEIENLTELDLVAILGDIPVGDFVDDAKESFKYVKKCLANIAKRVPYMHLQGNHDELPSDTTEKARQKYYAFIGANNVGMVTDYDNKFRNYGYRDFENYKVRVIYLNTADVSSDTIDYDNNITSYQMNWFANTALKLSDKEDSSKWGVIVCAHHPLNWIASGDGSITKILDVLNAYKGRTSGSVTISNKTISYDFSSEKSEFICHIHGHLHNFREEVLGTNKVLSITVPNASFYRTNEYGQYDYSEYPDVVTRYGDDGADNDGTKPQRVYNKTANTANDTSFSVFCIDRASKIVNVFNYGAGIDRKWDYANGVKLEVDDEGSGNGGGSTEPDTPDTPTPSYTNQIPLSVDADGSPYNGVKGYKTGYRINSSGVEAQQDGMCCTGFIPYDRETIRLKNVTIAGTKTSYLVEYEADKSYKQVTDLATRLTDDGNGVLTGTTASTCAFIRITCGVIDDTTILTLDEEIK